MRIKLNPVAYLAVKVNASQRTLAEKSHEQLTVTDLILPNLRAQTSALRQQFRRIVFNAQPLGRPHSAMPPNDPIPQPRETRPTGRTDCNRSAMALVAC